MLDADVFNLFVDGLDVLVDLALISQAFHDGFGQHLVCRIVFCVDLTERLNVAGDGFDVTEAEVCGE